MIFEDVLYIPLVSNLFFCPIRYFNFKLLFNYFFILNYLDIKSRYRLDTKMHFKEYILFSFFTIKTAF